eukprot:TRINITY_DN3751_c0_g1_i4.p1 TRINITY_DN3751_c0_g1~~TRINITY_DN3751_c0_g1_i4.p1  ORF type:complete len:602 (+),score=82.68 TRINITY_DN3751_c0_g1_i4:47-1852(+)
MTLHILELRKQLANEKILVTNDWLTQCHEHVVQVMKSPVNRILLEVEQQWLRTDISIQGVMEKSVFPPNVDKIPNYNFVGSAVLQVTSGYDIGNSAYSQLQKLYKMENENVRVSAENSEDTQSGYQPSQGRFVASWEPKASRMLKLSVTDGFQTLEAIEHERIDELESLLPPGLKIRIFGPVQIKRGKMLLLRNNVRVLGGSVEELLEEFSTENVLSQKLGKRIDRPAYPSTKPGAENSGRNPNANTKNSSLVNSRVQHAPPAPSVSTATSNRAPLQQMRASVEDVNDIDWDDDSFPNDMELDEQFETVPTATSCNNIRPPLRNIPANNRQSSYPAKPTGKQERRDIARDANLFSQGTVKPSPATQPKKVVQTSINSYLTSNKKARVDPSSGAGAINTTQQYQQGRNATVSCMRDQEFSGGDTFLPDGDFDLSSDMDVFDDVVETPMEDKVEEVSPEPFVYLSLVKRELRNNPGRRIDASIKAVSSTLAHGLKVSGTGDGAEWYIGVYLNDGSDYVQAELRGELLEQELGSPSDFTYAKQSGDTKEMMNFKLKKDQLSKKLAQINGIIKLRFVSENNVASVLAINELSGLHLAKLRRRKLR